MAYARQMLDSYRRSVDIDPDTVAAAIEALDDCAQACTADVDANLSEPNVDEMVRCIRLCLQCTDICSTAGAVSSRLGDCEADVIRPLIEACVAARTGPPAFDAEAVALANGVQVRQVRNPPGALTRLGDDEARVIGRLCHDRIGEPP